MELIPEGTLPSSLIFLCMDDFERLTSHWSETCCLRATCPDLRYLSLTLKTWEFFPKKENSLPTGLTHLRLFDCHYLKELNGKGLQILTSLLELNMNGCSRLQSLPEDGIPSFVSRLLILDCSKRVAEGKEGKTGP